MKSSHWCSALVALALACNGQAFAHSGAVDDKGCHVDANTDQRHCHAGRARKTVPDGQHPPQAGDEGVFFGPFVSLSDGDTFSAKIQGVVMEFRLSDIDAPEYDQPYGQRSREELRSLISGRQLVIVFRDVDRYGRVVADVWDGKLNINTEMTRRGAAWFYARYARNEALFDVEEQARNAGRGLWALPVADRVEPWIWRERKRQAVAPDDGIDAQRKREEQTNPD